MAHICHCSIQSEEATEQVPVSKEKEKEEKEEVMKRKRSGGTVIEEKETVWGWELLPKICKHLKLNSKK